MVGSLKEENDAFTQAQRGAEKFKAVAVELHRNNSFSTTVVKFCL